MGIKGCLFLKRSMVKLVIVASMIASTPVIYGMINIESNYESGLLVGKEIDSGINNTSNLLNPVKEKGRNFANNPKEALEWSKQYFPDGPTSAINSEDLKNIQEANNELRTKYLNRSELYENQDFLNLLDQNFITVVPESIVLYANFTSRDFGINNDDFKMYTDYFFNTLLEDSLFGIDHGYFLGSLTPRPLDSGKGEIIQIKLEVPKETKVIRVGSLDDSQFILKREQTLKYTEKSIKRSADLSSTVSISAELVDKIDLENEKEKRTQKMGEYIERHYGISPNVVELTPLGLNAGLVLSQGQNVAQLALDSLSMDEMFSAALFDKWNVVFTNGMSVHTNIFTFQTNEQNLDEQKAYFEENFDEGDIGVTLRLPDGVSLTSVHFNRLESAGNLRQQKAIEEFAGTFIHELFHHLIYTSNFFIDHPMFENHPETSPFLRAVREIKRIEEDALAALLTSDYPRENQSEFICEAFRAKFHYDKEVSERFVNEVPRTNRLLINLFDTISPSIPTNVREVEVGGNSATITFNHSIDTNSVKKYNLYINGLEDPMSIETKLDAFGLAYPEPGKYEDDLKVPIDGLEQNTEYEIQVSAVDEARNESEKSPVLKVKTKDIEPPRLQGNMSGRMLSSFLSYFQWSLPTDNVGVSGIRIRRTEAPNSVLSGSVYDVFTSEEIFILSGDSTYFSDYTIEEGKTYKYSMTALDAAGNESERSNEIVLRSSEDDDRRQNEDRGENTTASHSTLNWNGVFEASSSFGFQIFNWSLGTSGWIFGGTTFVSGSELSTLVNLNPGMLNLFQVVPIDEVGNPLDNGLVISVESFDHSSLTTKDSNLYAGEKWELGDNFVSATDEDNQSVSWEDPRVTSNGTSIDISNPGVYTLKYQFNGLVKTTESIFNVRVKENHSSIKTRDSTLYVGEKWVIENNFVSATDEEGQEVPWGDSRITLDEGSVDTSKPGVYTFTYHFNGKAKTLDSTVNVTVREDHSSIATKDSTLYVGENWEEKDNIVSATDEEGKIVPWGDPRLTSNEASVDTSKPGVYTLTYSFKGRVKRTDSTLNVTVKADQSSITTKDSTVYVRGNWTRRDNFVSATDEDGKVVPWEDPRITTNEASVDTSKPGVQTLTYSFKGKVKRTNSTLKVTVKELTPPKNLKASEAGMTSILLNWDVEEASFQEEANYEIYQDGQLIQTVTKNQLPYKVENLQSAHAYSFTVKTRIGTEVSKPSGALTVQTKSLPLKEIIKSFTFDSSGVLVTFDRASFEANNRIVLVKNGVYIGETYNNKVYSSSVVSKENNTVKVRFKCHLLPTDKLELQLRSGRPGGLGGNTVLEKMVLLPLDSPKNLKASEIETNSVNLTWEAGENSALAETKYEIYQDGQRIQTVDKNQLTVKVANLQVARTYVFTVKAKVGIQGSVSSNECTVQTKSLPLQEMVKGMNLARVTLDRASYEGYNRLVFIKNGTYIGETYNNTSYSSVVFDRTETTVTIDFKTSVVPTDKLEMQLRSGHPGGGNTILERMDLLNTSTYNLIFRSDIEGTGSSSLRGIPSGHYGYNVPNIGNMLNDAVSYVQLPPRSTINLYEHSNYGGRSTVLFNPTETEQLFDLRNKTMAGPSDNIYNFDKITSSYKFYNHNIKLDFALWVDAFAQGKHGYYGTANSGGSFSLPNADAIGREFSDSISSVVLPPKSTMTLYEHINYGGRSKHLSNPGNTVRIFDLGSQGHNFNDITSSLKFDYLK